VAAETVGYQIDKERLVSFCRDMDVPFHYRTIAPDLEKDPSKGACFVCSWHRRKKLFSLTRELKCNRLALGHHRNDAVETLLLNMIYHGSISSLPYSLEMFNGRLKLIRPMMDLEEGILDDYSELNDMVRVERSCPHENRSQRERISSLVREIEKLHGRGPYNIFRSMDKICADYLPVKGK
jgi:tRNA(Ile)-lysidine synthase TilS/MesJ